MFGVSWKTVRAWDDRVLKLPIQKSSEDQQSRVYISVPLLLKWYDAACLIKPTLEKYRPNVYRNLRIDVNPKNITKH